MKSILSYQLLFHQSNIIEMINLYSFDRDNQDILNINHYFIKKISNFRKNNRSMIIDNLYLIYKWNDIIIINSNEIKWNQRNINQYYHDWEFFLEFILLNMNFIYKKIKRNQEILFI